MIRPVQALVWGGCVTLTMAMGCPHPRPLVSLDEGVRHYTSEDYDKVLNRWTRTGDLLEFQGLEEHLTATATFLSWDFRWAYVARYAHDARLSLDDRAAMLQTALETARREHEFYIALEAQSPRWGDLTGPNAGWRVLLVDDRGRQVTPVRVERVRRPAPADLAFFPYITPWRQVFRVHFPRRVEGSGQPFEVLGPGTRFFLLRFSGPFGTLDLRWDVLPQRSIVR